MSVTKKIREAMKPADSIIVEIYNDGSGQWSRRVNYGPPTDIVSFNAGSVESQPSRTYEAFKKFLEVISPLKEEIKF